MGHVASPFLRWRLHVGGDVSRHRHWKSEIMYRSIPKPPMPPLPRANPRAFDFCEKFWSNSPLCCQFRRSNAPPVRASKRVKSPTLQACEANCGNKFCKIFSHYEFLVQLVFGPHFKQRHIPRCNYIKRQQQKILYKKR